MKYAKLNPISMAWTVSIFGGAATFLIAILGQIAQQPWCRYSEQLLSVLEITNPFYIFDLSTGLGVVLGTIEALVFWFVVGYVFAWLYNKLS